MINLKTAKALKAAGLVWQPQYGDKYEYEGKPQIVTSCRESEMIAEDLPFIQGYMFLPRLDQILAEIEKRDMDYTLWNHKDPVAYTISIGNDEGCAKLLYQANTPDEVAAQALLWILKEGER